MHGETSVGAGAAGLMMSGRLLPPLLHIISINTKHSAVCAPPERGATPPLSASKKFNMKIAIHWWWMVRWKWINEFWLSSGWNGAARRQYVFNCWICMFARSRRAVCECLLSLYLLCAGAECEFACARLYIWMCMWGRNCCADANSFANHPAAAARLRFPISYWPLAHNADIAKQGTYRILHTAQFSAQKVTRTQHPTVWFLLKGHKIASTGPANCTKFARVEKSP